MGADRLLAQLADLLAKEADGVTTQDIADLWKVTTSRAQKFVRKAVRVGGMECIGWRRGKRVDGRDYQVPVYAFTDKGPEMVKSGEIQP